jgi:multimeric flavodoxin WrbA
MPNEQLEKLIQALSGKKKVLLLTTSNRWEGSKEIPKSTLLAMEVMEILKETTEVSLLEIPKLKIFPCEGNVSGVEGNNCGVKGALLKDEEKDPSGYHRCWASLNNKEDELWKVSKELFESDAVIFFISVRWGQANAFYQKLIERLNWIENMHTTLGEENIVANIDAGCVILGQNWNGEQVLETQKQVYEFYGFNVPDDLSFYWQYTQDSNDESQASYKDAPKEFGKEFEISITRLKESLSNKFRFIKRLMDF